MKELEVSGLTALDRRFISQNQVVTVQGKGNKAVPIIIPPDCAKGMAFIADKEVRDQGGIPKDSIYLFGIPCEYCARNIYVTVSTRCCTLYFYI